MIDGKILRYTVGIGQCGGKNAEGFKIIGISEAFIANSSAEDLVSIEGIDASARFKISSIQGTGKNRQAAYLAFKGEYEQFFQHLQIQLGVIGETPDVQPKYKKEDYDIIFLPVGAGGGTGSGILPVLARLLKNTFTKTRIVPIVFLPSMYERGIAQQNALDCLRELTNENFTMMVVDNSMVEQRLIHEKYEAINKYVAEAVFRLLECDKYSKESNIDTQDRLAMFSDPGLLSIAFTEVSDKDNSPLLAAVKRAISTSPIIGDHSGGVSRLALQFECNSEYYTQTNVADVEGFFKNIRGIFHGYYKPAVVGNTEVNRLLVAYAGAKIPDQNLKDRQAELDLQYKGSPSIAANVSEGNKELKNAWLGNRAEDVQGRSAKDIFDEFSRFHTEEPETP
jgi:cell division GTPase FtsZ